VQSRRITPISLQLSPPFPAIANLPTAAASTRYRATKHARPPAARGGAARAAPPSPDCLRAGRILQAGPTRRPGTGRNSTQVPVRSIRRVRPIPPPRARARAHARPSQIELARGEGGGDRRRSVRRERAAVARAAAGPIRARPCPPTARRAAAQRSSAGHAGTRLIGASMRAPACAVTPRDSVTRIHQRKARERAPHGPWADRRGPAKGPPEERTASPPTRKRQPTRMAPPTVQVGARTPVLRVRVTASRGSESAGPKAPT
jgi:hypothetical protein